MTRFEAMQKQRRDAHAAAAQGLWAELRVALDALGVEHRLFGSFAHGDFLEHSDIDLMIMGDPDRETRHQVRQAVQASLRRGDVDIDLHFAKDLPPETCEALLDP